VGISGRREGDGQGSSGNRREWTRKGKAIIVVDRASKGEHKKKKEQKQQPNPHPQATTPTSITVGALHI
jgi:hypothetical protein